MKASNLIQLLERHLKDGDFDVVFNVTDDFGRHGHDASAQDIDFNSGIWHGAAFNRDGKRLTLTVALNASKDFITGEEKKPKITFRK